MIFVFGGSFNPVTKAHIDIYLYLKERFTFSKFVYLPTSTNYSKEFLESNTHRYEMLKIATKEFSDAYVDDFELKLDKYKGTYYYLTHLEEEATFVMGLDNFKKLSMWIEAEKLISEFKFIILSRGDESLDEIIKNDPLLKKNKENFTLIKDFKNTISASAFRSKKDSTLIPQEVYNYIKLNKLYGESL